MPLLDKEVLEVAIDIDWESNFDLKRRIGKRILRKSLTGYTSYQTTGKRGFSVPIGEWLRTSMKERFIDTVLSREEIAGLPISRDAIGMHYRQLLSGRDELAWSIWSIFMLANWCETHLRA